MAVSGLPKCSRRMSWLGTFSGTSGKPTGKSCPGRSGWVFIEPGANQSISRDQALLRDRVTILYALSDHYLFLPFAALCMAASLVGPHAVLSHAATPLILLIAITVVGGRLKAGYDSRKP